MGERVEHKPSVFVGVPSATLIYVGIAKREDFDRIAAPCHDHGANDQGHVLTKKVGDHRPGEVTVIFQHWVKSLTIEALYQDAIAKQANTAAPRSETCR